MLMGLNMAPPREAKNKLWWTDPWTAEAQNKHGFIHAPKNNLVPGEDGDSEVLRERLDHTGSEVGDVSECQIHQNDINDGSNDVVVAEFEARACITKMLDEQEAQSNVHIHMVASKINPCVEYKGYRIYKSTLVSQLNGNPWLSKDRLTRVRNSIYFNSSESYIQATTSSSDCLLGLGSDCGVYFVETAKTPRQITRNAKKGLSKVGVKGKPTNMTSGADHGTWWLGKVQKIRRRIGSKWGVLREPIDLFNKPFQLKQYLESSIMVLLCWFSRCKGHLKFKYDYSDPVWVDIETIITTVALKYDTVSNIYSLDEDKARSLNDFVSTKSL